MARDYFPNTTRIYARTNPFQYLYQWLTSFHKRTGTHNLEDNAAFCVCRSNLDFISNKLPTETNAGIKCLKNNKMVANLLKIQLMFLSKYKNLEKNLIFPCLTKKGIGSLLWKKLLNDFNKGKSLFYFKNKIREWKGRSCTCCICS